MQINVNSHLVATRQCPPSLRPTGNCGLWPWCAHSHVPWPSPSGGAGAGLAPWLPRLPLVCLPGPWGRRAWALGRRCRHMAVVNIPDDGGAAAHLPGPQCFAGWPFPRCETAAFMVQYTPYGLAERPVPQARMLLPMVAYACLSVFFLSLRRAITVRSPVVACPIFTHTSVPMGRKTSTLDPSFMKPRCSSI